MNKGRIKWYNEKKGYGFIERDDGEDLFFHQSSIKDHGHFGLQKTDPVSFEIHNSPRGPQAINVKAL
ncbi:MAG: cold shock domain-containing protein [Desulfobacterales bacterium]|nr:cold shock domain-containing protein [Desulfobacterales bacterium]